MSKFKEDNAGYIRCLEGVAIGDAFMIWEGKWDSRLVKVICSKVTPKQCEIGRHKYRIADARGLGGSTWQSTPSLMLLRVDEMEKDRQKHEVTDMRRNLGSLDWKNIGDGSVKAVFNIVWGGCPTKGCNTGEEA